MASFYNLSVNRIAGKGPLNFADLKGKAVLIVNVASACGYTKHYTGLEALNKKYGPQGLVVIGFPCNQFGGQEPGSEAEIVDFCSRTYNVTFDLTQKVEVNGPGTHPVFAWLKQAGPDSSDIKWNFGKFLVSKDGNLISRHAHSVTPEELDAPIAKALL
ncbi:putative glutathione peroxidase [Chytriomyces sp. MP71]|nr:putative glutathione peroxidase [Chytriomyces sp. MP71]